jgi:hypothetical protein
VQSAAFAPLLRLDEAGGQVLSRNSSPGPGTIRHTQILFTPKQSSNHRLTVSSFLSQGGGAYVLQVGEFAGSAEASPPKQEHEDEKKSATGSPTK